MNRFEINIRTAELSQHKEIQQSHGCFPTLITETWPLILVILLFALQITQHGYWHAGAALTDTRWAHTCCPWWSQTMTTQYRAVQALWPCECVLVTAVGTCSHAVLKHYCLLPAWAPGLSSPSYSVSSYYSVSRAYSSRTCPKYPLWSFSCYFNIWLKW